MNLKAARPLIAITSVAFATSLALHAFAQGGALTPAQQQLRAIYQELVEINTTDSAGSCTAAAEAMAAGATDGRFTINAGIPTYGISGIFHDPDGSGVHGLNERIRVRSIYEGHEFLYRLVKLYAGGR